MRRSRLYDAAVVLDQSLMPDGGIYHVTFQNARIIRHVGYPDAEEALAAVGIS